MRTRLLGLISGSQNVAEVGEGVEFDGSTDYLSRTTDLVGNTDSKTFTFSCWYYHIANTTARRIYSADTGTSVRFGVYIASGSNLYIVAQNTTGTVILSLSTSVPIQDNTFINILFSIDMNNTANRYLYINDVQKSMTFSTYTNTAIDFTNSYHYISSTISATTHLVKGRLSHIFLDYTYRDLSIEANRRLFITADGKPTPTATLQALNPILYLPMKDAATCHINLGTGGNFVQNGTLDTSSRGANQDNCVASYFDGSSDYLSRTSLTGIADGKQFVLSFNINVQNTGVNTFITSFSYGTTGKFYVYSQGQGSGVFKLVIIGTEAGTTTQIINALTSPLIGNVAYNISISIDLSDVSKRYVMANNSNIATTWNTYINSTIDFTLNIYNISLSYANTSYFKGNIGELYFDTKYIDLATSNPFWDATENKPKPVRQVIRETGVTPLIAMPLDASNPGKNYGTGGDFTANSAPYVGARGASEFWARSAKSDGSTGRLSRGNIPTLLDSKTVSCLCAIYLNSATAYDYILSIGDSGILPNFKIMTNGTTMWIDGSDSTYTRVMQNSFSCTTGQWLILFASFDLANTSNRYLSLNGVVSSNWSTYINAPLGFTGHSEVNLFNDYVANTANIADACIGSIYFTTDYINFSQEVNRNKFVDQLGYPKDLKAQIEAGVIPQPLIYLPFDEPTNLGKNLGTGGNFTVNGTVTAGADVLG